jgi:glycosyltransferase involved in cell wall biosynthesis
VSTIARLRRIAGSIRRALAPSPAALAQQSETQTQPASNDSPVKAAAKLPFAPRHTTRFESAMPVLPRVVEPAPVKISIVVIVYKMPEQAKKTLYSLSTDYQTGVVADDYEVIVVENESDQLLGEAAVRDIPGNFHYHLRKETRPTPVFAVNFGAAQATGTHIAVVIDGARMCTPGVVSYMLAAARLSPHAVIAVPGYHLGHELQQVSILNGYTEAVEAELLASVQWPADGYRLFEIACLSGSCSSGFFKPIGESNCFAVPKAVYEKLGGFDENFTETGGGQVNLDFYKRAVELPETQLVILPGEGCFHQLHGEETMAAHFAQYGKLRGEGYSPPGKRAIYLGALPDSALKFIRHGSTVVMMMNDLK